MVAAGRLVADVDQGAQARDGAERLVAVHRLVRRPPAPGFDARPVGLAELDQRLVEGEPRHLGAGLLTRRLDDVAPGGGAVDVAEHPLDEDRVRLAHEIGVGSQPVDREPALQRPHPGGVDQRLGLVLGHLAVPVGEPLERDLAAPLGGVLRGGLAGVPQVAGDQRQQHPRGLRHRVGLDVDEALQRVVLAPVQQPPRAQDAVGIAPVEADVVGEGRVGDRVVGVDDDAPGRADHEGVGLVRPRALPVVAASQPGAGMRPREVWPSWRSGWRPTICWATVLRRRARG
jgi:hypothetical protein